MTTNLVKKACVFCNGYLKNPAKAKRAVKNCDLLIAADGGARYFLDMGLAPQVIIGDMDSINLDLWKNKPDIKHIRYPADKDKSDAELAVEYALAQGCMQIILIAANGGRLDHTFGNIALAAAHPGRVAILDGTATLVAVDKTEKCILHGKIGTVVSLIPYNSNKITVRTNGLKYSLQDECLKAVTHGLSNELSQPQACICVSNGILIVYIETQDATYSVSLNENDKRNLS